MPQIHRPDVEIWQSLRNGHTLEDEDTLALMWPNLNAEDLSNKETLLLMLHQRSRYPPHKFATHDIGMLNFGMRNGLIGQIELPGYFAVLRDRDSPDTYGKLYSWEEDTDDVKSEPTRGWFTAGDSYWAVVVQSQIFWFLNEVCKLILHDMSPEEIYPAEGGHLLSQTLPDHLSKTCIEGVEILAIKAYEDQYKAPGETEFARCIRLIGAKLAHAEDHLWALREDPGYMIFAARDRMEHMTEMVPDEQGNPGPPPGINRHQLWGRVFNRLITEAIANVDLFNVLFKKVCHLNCAVVERIQKELLFLDKPLGWYVNETLFETFYDLIASSWELIATVDFEPSAFSSPLLRDSFYRTENESALGHPIIRPRSTIILDCIRDRLLWIFNSMSAEHSRFDMGVRGLIGELDLWVRQEPKAKALITPFIAGQVSTLGIFSECLFQLEYFQPWIAGYRLFYHQNADRLIKNWSCDHEEQANIGKAKKLLWETAARCLKVDENGEHVFLVQNSPTPTKKDIEERRSVEAGHDKFWSTLLRGLRSVSAVSDNLDALFTRDKFRRTAPWVEPAKAAKKGKKKKKGKNGPVDPLDQILDEAIAQNKKMEEDRKKKAEEKAKKEAEEAEEKAKKDAEEAAKKDGEKKEEKSDEKSDQKSDENEVKADGKTDEKAEQKTDKKEEKSDEKTEEKNDEEKTDEEEEDQPIEVSKRALKVLKAILTEEFGSSYEVTKGVQWNDFVHAVMSIGFEAEKIFGSGWIFTPDMKKLGHGHPIYFEEPYLCGEIHYLLAKHYGWRLRRSYGFKRDMFKIAGPQPKEAQGSDADSKAGAL
ncbi:hypothetical protein F4805DRAFT_324389 [Annulohypoxylon moriforme]|nr:hypothetical protein F4805DRAFT_324389 [Annulohypoxylon moriforme]